MPTGEGDRRRPAAGNLKEELTMTTTRRFEDLTQEEQAIVRQLERHHPERMPFTPRQIEEWLQHVAVCGGYDKTALGE
jgi:hypothetical protein